MKTPSKVTIGLTAIGAFLVVIGYGLPALAQPATPKPSSYATDVQAGQVAIQSDPAVASNAKDVNESEGDNGNVDNEPAEVKEAIEPQEATETAETGESGDPSGGSGQESSGVNGNTSGDKR